MQQEYDVTTKGYKTVNSNGEVNQITVEKKKSGFTKGVGKIVAFTIGGFGILISCLLFITIIGIIPAIGLFFMSLGIIYAAIGKQQVKCPSCNKKNVVLQTKENFTCAKCHQLTIIDWKQ